MLKSVTPEKNQESSKQLPKGPQRKITAWVQRKLIENFGRKVKGKNLADSIFIGKVEDAGKKAKKSVAEAKLQLMDWKAAEKRYEQIVAYVEEINKGQKASLADIIAAQEKIEKFQEDLADLLGTLTDNDGSLIAQVKEMQDKAQKLYDAQKALEKQLDDGVKAVKEETPPAAE